MFLVEVIDHLPGSSHNGDGARTITVTAERDIVIPNRQLDLLARHRRHRRIFELGRDMLLGLLRRPWLLLAVDDEFAVGAVLDVAVEFSDEGEAKFFGYFLLDCAGKAEDGNAWGLELRIVLITAELCIYLSELLRRRRDKDLCPGRSCRTVHHAVLHDAGARLQHRAGECQSARLSRVDSR